MQTETEIVAINDAPIIEVAEIELQPEIYDNCCGHGYPLA